MLCGFLAALFIFAIDGVTGTHFYTPTNHPDAPSYRGYLWKDSNRVHLRPVLQAFADDVKGVKGEICGIVPHGFTGNNLPFYVEVLDRKTGLGEIKLKNNSSINFREEQTIAFDVEAYDCQEPPNFSKRAPVSVHILNRHGPVFDSLSYQFTVSQHSPTGTVVGQVAAIAEFNSRDSDAATKICDYQISPVNQPFSIDRYGVIRVGDGLEGLRVNRPYVFQVIAEDCHRPTPLRAWVDVQVGLLKQGCQQGWEGLPLDIEYQSPSDVSERLFWRAKPVLETCTRKCLDPIIQLRLELRSAMDETLVQTANSRACLHDPEHLNRQRKLCRTNPNTMINLLPDPDQDLAAQLVRPSLGSAPRVLAPAQIMRFSGASLSVWELDPKHLTTENGINAFDTNFTLSFWMRRHMGQTHPPTANSEDIEETVICSQDQNVAQWRFLSISFRGCQLIVRIMASFRPGDGVSEPEPRRASQWIFESLPEHYCSAMQWHHYVITFNRAPWALTTQLVSLLIDGYNPDLNDPTEILSVPNPVYIPSERKADPRITIGACFDPETRLTRQHLNAELTGMTLLLDEVESPSVLRCMAQCGESLYVPNVLKFLRPDINVTLESDAITIIGQNIAHVTDMLTAITYIRPQPGISKDYVATVAQSRLLRLQTLYQCPKEKAISLPNTIILLNVLPEQREVKHRVEQGYPVDVNTAGSVWIPENSSSQPNQPSNTVGDLEGRAKKQDVDHPEVPPLRISGPNVIVADPSTIGPGIPLFSDIKFKLWDKRMTKVSAESIAASVPLDSCNIWLASTGDPKTPVSRPKFNAAQGERIEWPNIMAINNGFSSHTNEYGVEIRGRKPAEEYARLLREFRYWPPSTLRARKPVLLRSKSSIIVENDVSYMANVELVCTLDAGNQRTSEFIVKVLIPNTDSKPHDRFDRKQVDGYVSLLDDTDVVHYGQSDRERRKLHEQDAPKLIPIGPKDEPSIATLKQAKSGEPSKGYAVGIVISSLIVVAALVGVVLLFLFKRDRIHRKLTRVARRPRVPEFPADFGGSSLKRDPTLRLTANPVGEMDYYGIGTLRENIHGSTRVLAPKQYIFSPPVVRREERNSCSSGSARLAGLEEFEEEYTGPLSECLAESDGHDDFGQEVNSAYHNYSEDQEGDGASDFSPPGEYGADICDWIDDDVTNQELMENNPNQSQEMKWELVANGPKSDHGPPAVDL